MNELMKCWLYIKAARSEYYYGHGGLSEKVHTYENVLWECFKYYCNEFKNKYKGNIVRYINGDIGIIDSIYTDIPFVIVEFDIGKQPCSITELELI